MSLDRSTRGKTRPGRLLRLDEVLLWCERELLVRSDGEFAAAPVLDVGFGAGISTSLELFESVRRVAPLVRLVAFEREPLRVAAVRGCQRAGFEVRQGGFGEVATFRPRPRLVRAMNVLRQYPLASIDEAHEQLGRAVVPGGLVLEGTSDRRGERLCCHFLRRTADGLEREALLLSSTFPRGFAPMLFRDFLPRDLRQRVQAGLPLGEFFRAWTDAWQWAARGHRPADAFVASVEALAQCTPGVRVERGLLRAGHFLWCPPGGVPR